MNSLSRVQVDLRDAVRGLRSGRGTTLLAFGILSVTMAAATLTFSVVDGIALRPLPYGSPERLVSISLPGSTPGALLPASPQDYFNWLDGTRAFESIGAARFVSPLRVDVDGIVEALTARRVTANLFNVLGIRPAAGRFFGPEHEQSGGPAGVILSHDLWVRRFRSDPAVIGRPLAVGQETRYVVGVLPAGVGYPVTVAPPPDLYIPYAVTAAERMNNRGTSMFVVGRMRPGVTVEQARADVQRISSAVVLALHDWVVGRAKTPLLLVLAAVALVLLVACANVACLLLVRAAEREREFAAREALGASRRRLAGILLFEGLILGLATAMAGVLLAFWGVGLVKTILPAGLTRVADIAVDGRVLIVAIGTAVLSGLVFSGAPAWLAARSTLADLIRAGGGAVIGGRRHNRLLSGFLVVDVAFVSVLLVATVLVVTSFAVITTADLGFDRRNVMTISYQRSLQDLVEADRPAAAATLRADLLTRARSVPGVTSVGIATNAPGPLSGSSVRYGISIPGIGQVKREDWLETRMVTPDYFRVMGMELIRGRSFEPSDGAGAPRVMLINDVAARQFFSDREPIGQVVSFGGPTKIIGVLRGVHFNGPEVHVRPEMYTPADQEGPRRYQLSPTALGHIVVRANRDPRSLSAAVREAIRPVLDTEPPPSQFLDDNFRRMTAGRRFNAVLMAVFGFIAVAIGTIGIYGMVAFVVVQQTRAIGLRTALGASASRIMRLELRNAMRPVMIGTGIGLAGALAMSRTFTSFVFGIRPTEPMVYVGVAGVLAFVGFAAALVPAWRAAQLNPVVAMRHE